MPQYLQDKSLREFFSLHFLHVHSSPVLLAIGIAFLYWEEPTPAGLYSPHPLQYELDKVFLSPHFGQVHVGPELDLDTVEYCVLLDDSFFPKIKRIMPIINGENIIDKSKYFPNERFHLSAHLPTKIHNSNQTIVPKITIKPPFILTETA